MILDCFAASAARNDGFLMQADKTNRKNFLKTFYAVPSVFSVVKSFSASVRVKIFLPEQEYSPIIYTGAGV